MMDERPSASSITPTLIDWRNVKYNNISSLIYVIFSAHNRFNVSNLMIWNMKKHLDFLYEAKHEEIHEELLRVKIREISKTSMGRELGVRESSKIEEIPLTSYAFYQKYYENPGQDAFMYPLDQYVKVITSGTMGKPKGFLIPIPNILDSCSCLLSLLTVLTYDGANFTLEKGDLAYAIPAPKPFFTGWLWETYYKNNFNQFVKIIPEDTDLSFHEKVAYFIKNHEKIDIAMMPTSVLLYQVFPQIKKPIKLKGFSSMDVSAGIFKEEIREITGKYPSVVYLSTETGVSTIPSIQHLTGFFFDWRHIYCEFLPEERAIEGDVSQVELGGIVPLDEVKPGKKYQPVVTPFKSELTRYVMPDLLECVSMGDGVLNVDLPIFRFFARIGKVLSMHNFTRINEAELITAFEDAGIPYFDFTARVETEDAREHLSIYLEPKEQVEALIIENMLHQQLYEIDKDYRDLTDFHRYTPLKLKLLPIGTFRQFLRVKPGMPKIDRVNMKGEDFKKLLGIARKVSSE
ncbi:MAG: GH3 auxin-responsive promoter family protein [Candidatus Geothermarchaeales archaeon]